MKALIPILSVLLLFSCRPQTPPDILNGRILVLGDSITQDGRYISIVEFELFKHYPNANIDLICIGLSSETVSGLTEPEHPYPRPNVHERLGRALHAVNPHTIMACYGMNDGIYFPQSDERFQAYKDGVLKLLADAKAIGAQVILLTPPIFDAAVIQEKVVPSHAEMFGYAKPFEGYNDVLAEYAAWLLDVDIPDLRVFDLNGPMLHYTAEQRKTDPDFALSQDGVHPQWAGHALMAQQVLTGLGVPIKDIDPQEYAEQLENDSLFTLVHERRHMRSMAWLLDIGFQKPGNYEALAVQDAEVKAAALKAKIIDIVQEKK